MQAFNEETLARAIRRSAIPVVTGVGHEVDLSIADLAADRRGATPSAAAELVSPSAQHLAQRVRAYGQRLETALVRELAARRQGFAAAERHLRLLHPLGRLRRRQQHVEALQRRLAIAIEGRLADAWGRLDPLALRVRGASPQGELARRHLIVDALGRRVAEAMDRILDARGERLARAVQGLEARSPLATLTRGFAILRRVPTGQVVTDAGRLVPGDRVDARLARGSLVLDVVEVVVGGDREGFRYR